jgi:prephenate dehydratase
LPQRPVVVDASEAEVGVGQAAQSVRGRADVELAGGDGREQLAEGGRVHVTILPGVAPLDRAGLRVGFLGPLGTFTEQALLSQPDLGAAELVPLASMPIVLQAVADGHVDVGFVAIENSIEGTVNLTQDALIFNHELLIQREVVLDVEQCLLGRPGTAVSEIKVVLSIPVATAQCQRFLSEHLPGAELRAANSTAEAARQVGENDAPGVAAIAPRVAGELYGLEVLAADIADHDGNQTRFVVVGRDDVPAPTGHDKTSVVVYQRADEPGSLISILQEFAARRINLSKLESRPTKAGGLGDYCFVIDADGHIGDELLADALRALHAKQGGVKFLGSYPAAGAHATTTREHADVRWRQADDWMSALRSRIR